MLRNRRIGLSITGVAQFLSKYSINTLKEWCQDAYKTAKYYDKVYSEWFAIPESIKISTNKPSGSVSLVAGATPGIHFPESKYYIRRVRLSKIAPFVQPLLDAGYKVEKCIGQEDSTVVVEFPVSLGENIRTIKEVSMWEQLNLAAFMQENWADNSVSVTVSFDPKTESDQIVPALNFFQYKLKAVSLLPRLEQGAYPQMPYEEITKEQYEEMISKLKPLDFSNIFAVEGIGEKYCNNDSCTI